MNNDNNHGNCINEILSVILVLQQNACPETCLDACDRPVLYTCCGNGTPWSMPTTKDSTVTCAGNTTNCSTIFRVEKIEGNCCTFRVLADNPDTTSLNPYVATNSFFTMDCDCLCAVRCLTDTFVDCVC